MALSQSLAVIHSHTAVATAGLVGADITIDELIEILGSRSAQNPDKTMVFRSFPHDVQGQVLFGQDFPILVSAEYMTPSEEFGTNPYHDSRLTSLGGTQSNLPVLWAAYEIDLAGHRLKLEVGQLAQLDHLGFERCLIFHADSGELAASIGVGEWSRPITFGEPGEENVLRFLLLDIAFDGSNVELAHSCIRKLKPSLSEVEVDLEKALQPFFPATSIEPALHMEESRQEADWIFKAITELSEPELLCTELHALEGLDWLLSRRTLNRQIVVYDDVSVWKRE
ncbi:MAG: hypothetical protein O2857_05780 [Planctomycetota bacterium]|nr:hypothetical protein [Planctomycetota bacterium]